MATEQAADARRQGRDAAQFVVVDETSANVTLTPRYARASHQERAPGHAPRNYDRDTTLVAALTPRGSLPR